MKRNLLISVVFLLLAGCTLGTDKEANNQAPNNNVQTENEASNDTNNEADLSLPDGFPADFPFPDNITITEVQDNSEGEQKSYTIRFTFDADMDLEPVFKMYADYTEKIDYKPMLEGEEFFKDGIFQYAALKDMRTSNMYVVTMRPSDGTYGSIDLKYVE